nr:hypothetical protein [Tanacetum cinerariifolium]
DKQIEEGNTKPRSLENFSMVAGIEIESDVDSEGEVVSADDAILAEFALMGLSTEIKCHQKNQLAYEEKIRVLSYKLEEKSNILEYKEKLIDQATQENQELMTKLDNEIANQTKWNNCGKNLYKLIDSSMSVRTKRGLGLDKYIGEGELGIDDSKFSIFHTNSDELEGQPIYNRFSLVDHMKAVPPPLTGNYMPPSNIPNIDESHMVYGKKATDSSEIKTNDDSISHSNDSVLFDFSDMSSEPSTNDFQTCDSSVECLRPNHSDHDSTDSISSVSALARGLEYISFDDLYNKLKFLEIDTKGYLSSSSTVSNAAFVSTAGSSQGNLSYQESGNCGYTTTLFVSPGSLSSKGSLKSKCKVVDDVIYSFFVNYEIDQHLVYEDLDQMNKEEFEEYDLKHQMAMLSIKVHRFEKKHGRKIKFNGRENARFDKKLVKCFNCKQMGHFSRECQAQGGKNSNSYQKYKSKEVGKDGSDSKVMVVVDGSIDWDKQTEEGNTEPRSLENFGMVAGIEIASDADSEGEVVSADNAIPTGVFVFAGDVVAAVVSPQSETEFTLMGLSTEAKWNNSGKNLYKLIDSSMLVRTKRGLGLDKHIGEGELGIDDFKFSIFHTNSDELEGQPIYNRFALVDHMKAVPPPLTGNYMPPSNIPDIDESHMVYGKKAIDSSEIKTNDDSISYSHDSVLFYFSDRVFAPVSESRDTIVIDCDRQEDFPSVCTSSIETDFKSSKTLCNKFGSFNKESHFRKHKYVASESCYVCGSYLHLIKDCDLHEQRFAKRNVEGNGILGRRPTGKPVNPNRPKPVSAGQQNLFFAGSPNLVSAEQQNTVSAGQPNPVSAANHLLNNSQFTLFALYDWLEKAKDRGIVDSGCSRSMSGNKDKLEAFEDFDGREVTFGGSTRKILGKGTIKTKNLNFENVLYIEELQQFNLILVS